MVRDSNPLAHSQEGVPVNAQAALSDHKREVATQLKQKVFQAVLRASSSWFSEYSSLLYTLNTPHVRHHSAFANTQQQKILLYSLMKTPIIREIIGVYPYVHHGY